MERRSVDRSPIQAGHGALRVEQISTLPIHRGHVSTFVEPRSQPQTHVPQDARLHQKHAATNATLLHADAGLRQVQGRGHTLSWAAQKRTRPLLRRLRRGGLQQPFR